MPIKHLPNDVCSCKAWKKDCYLQLALYILTWCNGSTIIFGVICIGSNPVVRTVWLAQLVRVLDCGSGDDGSKPSHTLHKS